MLGSGTWESIPAIGTFLIPSQGSLHTAELLLEPTNAEAATRVLLTATPTIMR